VRIRQARFAIRSYGRRRELTRLASGIGIVRNVAGNSGW